MSRDRRGVAAAVASVCLLTATVARVAADEAPPRTNDWVAVPDPSSGTWRTRDLLDAQNRQTGPVPKTTGVETEIIMDDYYKSIGKGGAGADLLRPQSNGSSSSAR